MSDLLDLLIPWALVALFLAAFVVVVCAGAWLCDVFRKLFGLEDPYERSRRESAEWSAHLVELRKARELGLPEPPFKSKL